MRNAQSVSQSFLPGPAVKPEAYREVIADLRRRGDHYHAAAEVLQRLSGSDEVHITGVQLPFKLRLKPEPKRGGWKKGRAKTGGSDEVVFGVIRDGADTMKRIIADSKVKPYVALCAVKRLVAAKRVKAEGGRSTRRYVVAK